MSHRIDRVDPDTVSEADLTSWHRCQVAVCQADFPDDPPPNYEELVAVLRHGDDGPGREADRWLWFARDDTGDVVGTAQVAAQRHENSHLAGVDVSVHPDHRGAGLGRALFDTAVGRVREVSRTGIFAWTAGQDAPVGFATAMGMNQVGTETRALLRLANADLGSVVAFAAGGGSRPDGFSPIRWAGPCPDELLDAYAAAWRAVNDVPRIDLVNERAWTPARLRHRERVRGASWKAKFTLAVREDATGALAGFTEVTVRSGRARAKQGYTVVPAEYRGRGFGLWLKAAMIEWLRTERPDVTEYETSTADVNAHMNAVNERLGFRPIDPWRIWQRSV